MKYLLLALFLITGYAIFNPREVYVLGESAKDERQEVTNGPVVILAEVTAYNPVEAQTDRDPTIMANGKMVFDGAAACPNYMGLGDRFLMDGKEYVCADRMAKRYREGDYFDILEFDLEAALNFGRVQKEITLLTN